jgi:hypothetical protein
MGIGASELKKIGLDAFQLKAAGCSARELYTARFSVLELKHAEFDILSIVECGPSGTDLRLSGCQASELFLAGFTAQQLKDAGFSALDLKTCKLDICWLLDGGWTVLELTGRRHPWEKADGFSVSELLAAGLDLHCLAESELTVQELKDNGFEHTQLKDAGIGFCFECRDRCIGIYHFLDCDSVPEGDCIGGFEGDCGETSEKIAMLCQFPRSWRVLNWFCAPYETFCTCYAFTGCFVLACSLPCVIVFLLSRLVRTWKGLCGDSVFKFFYVPLLVIALSFRWFWKHLCCSRSFFGLARSPCDINCTINHRYSRCLICGEPGWNHGSDYHSCYDGSRGSFGWKGDKGDPCL